MVEDSERESSPRTDASSSLEDDSTDLHDDPPQRLRNNTDYDFPHGWRNMTVEAKHRWYVRERVFRQAIRQDTAFGRRYRAAQDGSVQSGIEMVDAWQRAGRGGYRYE